MEGKSRTAAATAALPVALGGQSPRARGLEKMHQALGWIYRWGWSTPSVVDALAGSKAAGLASRLVRRGLLQRTRTESGGILQGVPACFLTLTDTGLLEIERFQNRQIEYELDPSRYRQALMRHDAIAQRRTLTNLKTGSIVDYRTEREIAQRSARGIKHPDVVWISDDGTQIAVEIELTAKWGRNLDEFIGGCLTALERRGFSAIVVCSDSPALLTRYKKAFQSGSPFHIWDKDAQRKWRVKEIKTVPQSVEEKMVWQLLES